MRELERCLLPWEMVGKIPSHVKLPYGNWVRQKLSTPKRVAAIIYSFVKEFPENTVYQYYDWFGDGNGKVRSGEFETLVKEIDEKLRAAGWELLTEEEAERLRLLV